MAERWEDVEELLVGAAGDDLEDAEDVTPALVAFRGDELLFVAWLRLFAKGRHHEPIMETCSLAAVLGCDRLALSFGARVWSLDDPIPPVSADGDLRQRAVAVHMVDAAGGPVRTTNVLHPFELVGGAVVWDDRLANACVEGSVPELLVQTAMASAAVPNGDVEALLLVRWLTGLGHDVHLGTAVGRRLDAAAQAR